MKNFVYQNPTKIIFGREQIAALDAEIAKDEKIMLLYGGGSIMKNGVYEQVMKALDERVVVEFGGVPANPEYEVALEAVEVIKREKISFVLAVGGGSVIDAAKFIVAAAKYEGEEPWNILSKREEVKAALPFATVLTLPATGSEMNAGSVISRRETKEKLAFMSPLVFPKFSILDPQVIDSIPDRQIANGVVDAFNHVLEQYITYPAAAALQDRFAEGILQTLVEVGPRVLKDRADYEAASNFMWACTMALNGLIAQGVPTDWSVHGLGHELTALHGIDHACTLAIIGPNLYKHCFEGKKEKLAQFAERVAGVKKGSVEKKARKGIKFMKEFYHSLGINTKLSDYTDDYKGTAKNIAKRFEERGWLGLGEQQSITPKDVKKIVRKSY